MGVYLSRSALASGVTANRLDKPRGQGAIRMPMGNWVHGRNGAVVLLALLMPATSVVVADVGPRIVNGSPTQEEWATGALLGLEGERLSVTCSGALVGCRTFITAAHCVCPGDFFCVPDPNEYAVYLQHGGIAAVESVIVHPLYSFGIRSDVAVVRLAEPVTGIAPALINELATPPYETPARIVGFGRSRGSVDDAGIKRSGGVVLESCSQASVPVPEPAHICWSFDEPIGAQGEDSNTCAGDSGGPLFVGSGSASVVAGLTSGGANPACLAPDGGFDVNVFENRSFIEAASQGDLGPSACSDGTVPLDPATAKVIAAGSATLTKATQACRAEFATQIARYTGMALKAWLSCLDGVASGRRMGPCPDATLTAAIEQARSKSNASKLQSRCPAGVIAASFLGEACADASDAEALRACGISLGDTAVANLVAASYADPANAAPLSTAQARCQRTIASSLSKFTQGRLKILESCRAKADRGKAAWCPDARSESRINRARTLIDGSMARSCDDAVLAELAASATSGACVGTDGFTGGAIGVAACLADAGATVSDTLLATILPVSYGPVVRFEVAPQTSLLRITLNGSDPVSGTPHELDVYARLAAEASSVVFDFSSRNVGPFEALEIAAPPAGTWYVFVDEVAGKRVPYQLTITEFGL